LGGSIESWTNNIGFLSSRFRIIALDLPGFGLANYKRLSLAGAKQGFISALNGSAMAPRYNNKLAKIDTDMLLIWGREDRMIPLRFIRPFLEHSKSIIIVLEKCGHRPHIENPRLFNKIVKDFLME
jgi:2-hydroxy-6-oxonona-2,4-dienedioate hydrolase